MEGLDRERERELCSPERKYKAQSQVIDLHPPATPNLPIVTSELIHIICHP